MIGNLLVSLGLAVAISLPSATKPIYKANYQSSYTNYVQSIDSIDNYETYALFSNGVKYTLPVYNPFESEDYAGISYGDYCNWVVNYCNQNYPDLALVGFIYSDYASTGYRYYLFTCNNVEWINIVGVNVGSMSITGFYCNTSSELDDDSLTQINNYPSYNPNSSVTSYTYSWYYRSFSSSNGYGIFDYSSLKYTDINYYDDVYSVNGTSVSVYKTIQYITLSGGGHIDYYYNLRPTSYEQGYTDGFANGSETGYTDGYNDGNRDGYTNGYTEGWNDADNQDAVALTIFTGICEVGLLPVNVFLGILNFEVFGINIGGFVASLMTVAIVVIVLRVVLGGKAKND